MEQQQQQQQPGNMGSNPQQGPAPNTDREDALRQALSKQTEMLQALGEFFVSERKATHDERQTLKRLLESGGGGRTKFELKSELPKFGGNARKESLQSWITKTEHAFDVEGRLTEAQKVYAATNKLTGVAAAWWEGKLYTLRQSEGLLNLYTWSDLKADLEAHFQPSGYQLSLRKKIRNCRQTASVLEYTTTKTALLFQARDMSEEDKKFHYIDGLKPNTQQWVETMEPANLQAAVDLALRYDDVHFGNKTRRPQHQPKHDRMDIDNMEARNKRGPWRNGGRPPRRTGPPGVCWGCNKPGHMQRDCTADKKSENDSRQ